MASENRTIDRFQVLQLKSARYEVTSLGHEFSVVWREVMRSPHGARVTALPMRAVKYYCQRKTMSKIVDQWVVPIPQKAQTWAWHHSLCAGTPTWLLATACRVPCAAASRIITCHTWRSWGEV